MKQRDPSEDAIPATKLDAPDGHHYTDLGNAQRLIHRYGDRLRFVPAWGKWLTYDGTKWRIDHHGTTAGGFASKLGRLLLHRIGDVYADSAAVVRLVTWVRRSESAAGIAATLAVAATVPGVAVDHESLDADGSLFNVANGTIDLRSGKLRDHDAADLITLVAPVDYDDTAEAPMWAGFVERVLPDGAVRRFVQRLAGLALVGAQPVHVLPIHHGAGANGKTTLTGVLAGVLGSYAVVASRDVLVALKYESHPTVKAALFGKRFAHSGEIDQGARLNEAQIKELTGGDRITARRMREDPWEFAPTHLLWLHANHRPQITGTDDGIWRRVTLIPYDVQIPEHEQDPDLAERIVADEGAGVLNWMLDGLADYRANGLAVPDVVRSATARYRHESDTASAFIADCLVLDPASSTTANELIATHGQWHAANGVTETEKAHYQRVVERLKDHGATQHRGKGGTRNWHGVRGV